MFGKKKKPQNFNDSLSLSQLDIFPKGFGSIEEARERVRLDELEQEEYKNKYGDKWIEQYDKDHGFVRVRDVNCDEVLLKLNDAIFNGYYPKMSGISEYACRVRSEFGPRLNVIYDDRYNELCCHAPNDPRVNELLLKDALKTGKWRELPECLCEEYHRLAGDSI